MPPRFGGRSNRHLGSDWATVVRQQGVTRIVGRNGHELDVPFEAVTGYKLGDALGHLGHRGPDRVMVGVADEAEHRVAHDEWGFGGVEDDDRLTTCGTADDFDGPRCRLG